jgi:3-dehydroquinate synthase
MSVSTRLILTGSFATLSARLPIGVQPRNSVVVFDRALLRVSPEFRSWIKKWPRHIGFASGESLKDVDHLSKNLKSFAKMCDGISPRELTVIAVGGGSIGDFAGFVSSVFKRGVQLIHIPSTWLAAIDSSHGGKTALNLGGIKNQIGTFYSAHAVILVKSLLLQQPVQRTGDAMAEFAKVAIIDGGAWTRKVARSDCEANELLWKYLPDAINSKMKIVRQDPKEAQGLRQVLNLGHTFGHVLEAYYHMSHGASVGQGLFFALEWSHHRGDLNEPTYESMLKFLSETLGLIPQIQKKIISESKLRILLLGDKKLVSRRRVTFVFVRGWGRVKRENISISDIVREGRRQGWVKS